MLFFPKINLPTTYVNDTGDNNKYPTQVATLFLNNISQVNSFHKPDNVRLHQLVLFLH